MFFSSKIYIILLCTKCEKSNNLTGNKPYIEYKNILNISLILLVFHHRSHFPGQYSISSVCVYFLMYLFIKNFGRICFITLLQMKQLSVYISFTLPAQLCNMLIKSLILKCLNKGQRFIFLGWTSLSANMKKNIFSVYEKKMKKKNLKMCVLTGLHTIQPGNKQTLLSILCWWCCIIEM